MYKIIRTIVTKFPLVILFIVFSPIILVDMLIEHKTWDEFKKGFKRMWY